MAENFPADLDLTAEQELFRRLLRTGSELRLAAPGTDRYRETFDLGRAISVRDPATGTTTIIPDPVITYQITASLDPRLAGEANAYGLPFWFAVLPYAELDPPLLALTAPPLSGPFGLSMLIDSEGSVVVAEDSTYLIEDAV